MFKPTQFGDPVAQISDPKLYHELGTKSPKGHPGRTMSRTQLWDFGNCPHKWLKSEEVEPTAAMSFGDLADCIIVTPDAFEHRFAVAPATYEKVENECPVCGSRTDSAKCAKCKVHRVPMTVQVPWNLNSRTSSEWTEQQTALGKTVVKDQTHQDARKAAASFASARGGWLERFALASRGSVQILADWHDDKTGLVIPCKALLDFLPHPDSEFGDTIGDLKTTRSANYRDWQRQVFSDGLHYQAAMYLDMTNAATGLNYRCFEHLIVENTSPFEATHRMLSEEFLTLGRIKYQAHLRYYCQCLERGEFPGYDDDLTEPEAWMVLA